MRGSEFVVTVHPGERIVEVVYPPTPTDDSLSRFDVEFRDAASALGTGFGSLLDLRLSSKPSAELARRLKSLLTWARRNGMRRSARIIERNAVARLEANRLLKHDGVEDRTTIHYSRADAWAALVR